MLTLQRTPLPETPYPVVPVDRSERGLFSLGSYPFWLRKFEEIRQQFGICAILNGHLGFAKVSWLFKHWRPHVRYGIFFHGLDILKERQKGRRNPWKRYRFRAMVQSADLCITNSHFTARLLRSLVPQSPQVVVIYPSIDPQVFRPLAQPKEALRRRLGLPQKATLLLYVGRPIRRKGLDLLIQVLRDLPESYILVVVGPGNFEPYRSLAHQEGVLSRVVFRGYVTDEDLVAYYNAVDLFVMPVRQDPRDVEGFGFVYLEANACGTPVIGTRVGGVPEAIEEGVNGLLVEPDQPKALRDAILRLTQDSSSSQTLAEQGRKRVLEHFQWTQQAKLLREAYQRLCESSR